MAVISAQRARYRDIQRWVFHRVAAGMSMMMLSMKSRAAMGWRM